MKKVLMACVLGLLCSLASALDINQASVEELQGLKGMGKKTAESIVELREQASFRDWEDAMDRVKGLDQGKAKSLSKQGLTVRGKSYQRVKKKRAEDKAEKSRNPDQDKGKEKGKAKPERQDQEGKKQGKKQDKKKAKKGDQDDS